ncbi:lysine--tRNA ligase [Candidatus Pyrohabitans sp.]
MTALFWADRKAQEIARRKSFRYIEREIPSFERFVVKTSASISGVLHIGRLSDTIRGESVVRALRDAGCEAKLIWVAEDMDPLRKIPEGVPGELEEYIGTPVSAVPDPWGCHSSYAEHHVAGYIDVIEEFLEVKPERYSMREEYRQGNFRPFIRKLLDNLELVIEIQNKYRGKPLAKGWSPFTPVCRSCGRIITPRVERYEAGKVYYRCEDYAFEKHIARGCGYEGTADPLRDEGKLMWKSEWAAQWARWRVASEGAGKEYVVPGSAWWVNAEICERVLEFPMPVPIFYEHLMIAGEKMSASLGNVVYPHEWLQVAPPQLLRFLYNKKLMKTRSFSWRELPKLYDEYDHVARVYYGMESVENRKEAKHLRRLYEMSQIGEPQPALPLPFSHAAMVAQLFTSREAIVSSLKRSGHYSPELEGELLRRVGYAKEWVERYAPELRLVLLEDAGEVKEKLSQEQRFFLRSLYEWLSQAERSDEEIQEKIFLLAREAGISASKAFGAIYLATLGTPRGPRAGPFLASLEREWLLSRLRELSE